MKEVLHKITEKESLICILFSTMILLFPLFVIKYSIALFSAKIF